MSVDWAERAAWSRHRRELARLLPYDDGRRIVAMGLEAKDKPWGKLRTRWSELSPHPNLIDALKSYGDHGVFLRYAAIAWNYDLQGVRISQIATWGLELVDLFAHIFDEAYEEDLGLFLRPIVEIDLGGHPRVAFLPPLSRPPLLKKLNDGAFVYCIGELLAKLSGHVVSFVGRCLNPDRKRRFASLDELRKALYAAGGVDAVRRDDVLRAWRWCEEGVGWYLLRDFEQAHLCFRAASSSTAYEAIWSWGLQATADKLHQRPDDVPAVVAAKRHPVSRPPEPSRSPVGQHWTVAEPQAIAREAARDFAGALAIYRDVRRDPRTNRDLFTARARCHLQLGETGEAIDYANGALELDDAYAPALEVLIGAQLARYWHTEALRNAERLVAVAPRSARAHFMLGKSLFVNGRIPEAGDAFTRAAELDPKLLEAQLLLREVHRVTGNVRKSVGSQHAPSFDVPEQLAELRDVLVSGDTAAAITALRDERYARDADAQLLLAQFLAFDRRLDEAISVYDQLEATSHRTAALVGKATALLDLGRAGDALSIFEQLPDDADAAEGQARALEALGRLDEAAESYRRFIALGVSGSELRVRAAELWLANRGRR